MDLEKWFVLLYILRFLFFPPYYTLKQNTLNLSTKLLKGGEIDGEKS